MAKTEKELRQDIVDIGKLIYQKQWVAANDGNISVRLDEERILSTPTGVSKGMMNTDEQTIVDMQGRKIAGPKETTSEIKMHLAIYRARPDVQAVVHAHPPVSTGFATAGKALNMALLPEVVVGLGCIPLAAYGLPGTNELCDAIAPYTQKYDAIMMRNHGVVCYGDDLYQAFFRMETVEHFARVAFVAEMLGGPKVLPRLEVEKLFMSRARYGVHSNSSPEPGSPVVAEDLNGGGDKERIWVTRQELRAVMDEAVRAYAAGRAS